MIELEVLDIDTTTLAPQDITQITMEVNGVVMALPIPPNYGLITWNGSFLTVS